MFNKSKDGQMLDAESFQYRVLDVVKLGLKSVN